MSEHKVYVALDKEAGVLISYPSTEEPIIGEESLEEFKKELSSLYNINKILDMHFIKVTINDVSEESVCSCDVLKKIIKGGHLYSRALEEPIIPVGVIKFSNKVLDVRNNKVYWRPRKLEPITLSKGIIAKKTQTSKDSIVKLTEKETYRSIDFINDKELLSCYNKAEVYMSPEAYSMYKNWEKKYKSFIKVAEMILNSHRKRIYVQAGNQSGYTTGLEVPYKLPYSLFQFKQRVEGLFKDEMSWKNHGEWHLDHRKPLSWFALVKSDGSIDYHQVYESIALCNFKPITAKENMLKGAAIEGGSYNKKRYLFNKILVNDEHRQEEPERPLVRENNESDTSLEELKSTKEDLNNFAKIYFSNTNLVGGIPVDTALKLYNYEAPYVSSEMRKEIEYLFEHRYVCKIDNKYVWKEIGSNLKSVSGSTKSFKELSKTPNLFDQNSPEFEYLVRINSPSFLNAFNFLASVGVLTQREKSIKISEYKEHKAPRIFLTKEVYNEYLKRDTSWTYLEDKIREDYIDDQIMSELQYLKKKVYEVALLQYGYYRSSFIKEVPRIDIEFSFTKQEFKAYIESQKKDINWVHKYDTVPYNDVHIHYYRTILNDDFNKRSWLITNKKPLTEYSFINPDGTVNYSEIQEAISLNNFKVILTGSYVYKEVPVPILYKKILNFHLKMNKMIEEDLGEYRGEYMGSLRRRGLPLSIPTIKEFECVTIPVEVTPGSVVDKSPCVRTERITNLSIYD